MRSPFRSASALAFTLAVAAPLSACSSSSLGDPLAVDASADVARDAPADTGSPSVDAPADAPTDAACTLVAAYSSKNAVCNGCAQSRCCAEVNGCLGDPRCNDDYVNCILACALVPDDAGAGVDAAGVAHDCIAKCGVDFPIGRAAYDAAIGCVDTKCTTECQ
jgi:hypothetical protein